MAVVDLVPAMSAPLRRSRPRKGRRSNPGVGINSRSLLLRLSWAAALLVLFSRRGCRAAAVAARPPTTATAPARSESATPRRSAAAFVSRGSARTAATASCPPQPTSAAWLDGCKSALSSALAAACVKTLLQPIDALKTYQQHTHAASGQAVSLANAFRGIASRGGWTHFYAGLGVTVIGAMPGVALYFGVYSYCKRRLLTSAPWGLSEHPTLCVAISAALGNTVASFSRVPYEVLKQQLQTGAYSSTRDALSHIWSSGKARDLVFPKGGIAIQMWRDIPYAIVSLVLYESLQSAVKRRYPPSSDPADRSPQKALDFAVGGFAGGMGSWVTNPMDVVKTRLQTDVSGAAYGGSVATCALELWREGGPAAFLRGSVPRLMHKVPANAFFFLFYEVFRRVLRVSDVSGASAVPAASARRQAGPAQAYRRKPQLASKAPR